MALNGSGRDPSYLNNSVNGSSDRICSQFFNNVAKRRGLCFNCHSDKHQSAMCSEPKRGDTDHPPKCYRGQRQAVLSCQCAQVAQVNATQLAEVESKPMDEEVEVFSSYTTANVLSKPMVSSENELFVVNATINASPVRLLLDSGADHNILRHGI
ncbi:Aste57867_20524 [Aphanomyces stellatus]|uniref:Aste57867_20524 protein n=1 Tax=Aphanomyces stellatus TaxID=120398 RepID=A0A485LGL7_9STRA|nr:hypothetical protein As57867_020457 [Aphanomyces stellatus]VFT97209.1 Aste57867_20524 [Aphanomyces stellatus]